MWYLAGYGEPITIDYFVNNNYSHIRCKPENMRYVAQSSKETLAIFLYLNICMYSF